MTEKRNRTFNCMRSYVYDFNSFKKNNNLELSEQDWKKRISDMLHGLKDVDFLTYIFHDNDFLENKDGSLKKDDNDNFVTKPLHVHFIVKFKNPKTRSSVIKLLNISRKENCTVTKSLALSARYLTHTTENAIQDKSKHMYDISKVHTINCNYDDLIVMSKRESKNYNFKNNTKIEHSDITENDFNIVIDAIVSYLSSGDWYLDNAHYFLREYIDKHFDNKKVFRTKTSNDLFFDKVWNKYSNKFQLAVDNSFEHLGNVKINKGRNLNTTYIYGPGGSGKSRLASVLGKKNSKYPDGHVHVTASPMDNLTYDPAGNYRGENVSIFNDFSHSSMSPRSFCNTFDPHEVTPIASRNKDKVWFADYAYITCSETLNTFVHDMIIYSKGGNEYNSSDISKTSSENNIALLKYESLKSQIIRRLRFSIKVEHCFSIYKDAVTFTLFRLSRDSNGDFYHSRYKAFTCSNILDDQCISDTADQILKCMNYKLDFE